MLKLAPETPDQSSTLTYVHMTLYLNIFQGEPAISGFDWHITPYHNSSERLVTHTGAAFHCILLQLQPDHGKLTRFRVIHQLLYALFRLAFTSTSVRHDLNLAVDEYSPAHSSIGTR